MIEDYDLSMKIIVLGNGTVGKTSLVQRFAKNYFKEEYKKTLGVDFLIKKIYVKQIDRECEFLIYDCAGQKEFDSVTSKYYKGIIIHLHSLINLLIIFSSYYHIILLTYINLFNQDAAGAIIAFSSVDRDSFASVETWRKKMALAGCDNIPVILAQNKVDLIDNDNPIIREKEINAIANKLNLKLFKISVKENLNITQVFEDLVIQHLKLGKI